MIPLLRLSTPQESLSYKHNDSLSPSTFSPNFYEAFVLWTILSERGIVGTVFKTCILEAFKSVTEKSLRNTKIHEEIEKAKNGQKPVVVKMASI